MSKREYKIIWVTSALIAGAICAILGVKFNIDFFVGVTVGLLFMSPIIYRGYKEYKDLK